MKTAVPNGEILESTCKTDEELKADCQLLCDAYNRLAGTLAEKDGYHCSKCNNKGLYSVPVKDPRGYWREESHFCECQKMRKTIRRLNKSGLKNIITDYTFEAYKTDDAWQRAIKDAAIRFIQDEVNTWFFIGGASGAGKTHICTAISGHFLNHNKEVKYMLWRDDVRTLKANVNEPDVYDKMMYELKNAEVLYIDDLFKTGKTDDG